MGTVLWYSELKSCGFITPDGQTENMFVHYTALKNENERRILNKADRVTFEKGEHKGKPVAVNVQRTKADLPPSLSKKTEVENWSQLKQISRSDAYWTSETYPLNTFATPATAKENGSNRREAVTNYCLDYRAGRTQMVRLEDFPRAWITWRNISGMAASIGAWTI